MNSDMLAPDGRLPPMMPTRKADVPNTWVVPSGPPLVSTATMVKPAKLPIREKIMVMAMTLRIIGKVTYRMRCREVAPSIDAAS